MEKGFRLIRCPECSEKLRIPISEKDYETTKKIRCPKCGPIARVKIPRPAFQISHTKKPQPLNDINPGLEHIFDIFKKLFGKKPKT